MVSHIIQRVNHEHKRLLYLLFFYSLEFVIVLVMLLASFDKVKAGSITFWSAPILTALITNLAKVDR